MRKYYSCLLALLRAVQVAVPGELDSRTCPDRYCKHDSRRVAYLRPYVV